MIKISRFIVEVKKQKPYLICPDCVCATMLYKGKYYCPHCGIIGELIKEVKK